MTARPFQVDLGGQTVSTWDYGDPIPGKAFRATAEDGVKVAFTNRLPDPASVRWHGQPQLGREPSAPPTPKETTQMRTRPILITAAGITLALALAGCSSGDTSTAASSSGLAASSPAASSPAASGGMMNGSKSPGATMSSGSPAATGTGRAGDIAFAQLMIPHHEQAIQMADMAATNASSAQVKALAAQIKAAQDPEIQTMSGWLSDWGAPSTMPSSSSSGGSMDGMDMGGMSGGAGMMSQADMTKLDTTKGAAFDKMWLQMMITHHQGAISMAQQVASTTNDPQVKALAEAIIKGQTAEIATMKQMLVQ